MVELVAGSYVRLAGTWVGRFCLVCVAVPCLGWIGGMSRVDDGDYIFTVFAGVFACVSLLAARSFDREAGRHSGSTRSAYSDLTRMRADIFAASGFATLVIAVVGALAATF